MDTITTTLQRLAGEAYDAFETRERENGETYVTLRDSRPEWVYEAARAAHGDMLPDDWRYDSIQAAFGAVHDASDGADLTEVGDEYADAAVDAYTSNRLQWLASHLDRAAYCDEAVSEGLAAPETGIVDRIGMGQYMEAREIWASVVESLTERHDWSSDE